MVALACQKAPSAKRCIKTDAVDRVPVVVGAVRKHRAPNGALRLQEVLHSRPRATFVRKHRAPNGALRRDEGVVVNTLTVMSESSEHHKVH